MAGGAEPQTIGEEIRQTKPFSSRSQEAYISLLRTADEARRVASSALADSKITLQQYNVLRILRGAGEDGIPTLAIAERMIERTPGVTRLIDRMVDRGWVTRERCMEDRRRVWCRITPSGLDLLDDLDGPIASVNGLLAKALSEKELVTLIDLLDRVRAESVEAIRN